MPLQMNGQQIGQVFFGSTPISEVYSGSTLVWQNTPRVVIEKISDVWSLMSTPEHPVHGNGQYWNRSDQLVEGVPNWNDWPLSEVPYRIELAPGFTQAMGMFTSRVAASPANCRLEVAPEMDTSHLVDMTGFFWNAINLTTVPEYVVSACVSLKDFVGNCPKVTSVILRDCGRVQDVRNMFGASADPAMTALTRVELHGLGPALPAGHVLDLTKTGLDVAGAEALFDSLGTIPAGRTVTVTVPTSASQADGMIATDKGWTVQGLDMTAGWIEVTKVGTTTVAAPPGALRADVVLVGGGGAGRNLQGGEAGQWASGTIDTDSALTVTVGAGGSNGGNGGASTVASIRGAGGIAEDGFVSTGKAAGDYTAFGRQFKGGAAVAGGYGGNIPGGGGGAKQPGARGQVWLKWR